MSCSCSKTTTTLQTDVDVLKCQVATLQSQISALEARDNALYTLHINDCRIDSTCGDCACETPVLIDREVFGPNERLDSGTYYALTIPCSLKISQFRMNVDSVCSPETVDISFLLDAVEVVPAITVSTNATIDIASVAGLTNIGPGTLTVLIAEAYGDPDTCAVEGLRVLLSGCCNAT